MAEVKKRHKTLMIVLCCVLAVVVILGGTVGIWALYSVLNPPVPSEEPDSLESTRKELGEGQTYSSLASTATGVTGLDNLAYMAWVLDNQAAYHVEAFNTTESGIYTQYTKTYKDYKNIDGVGYMVASDLTYSSSSVININSGMQALYVLGDTDGAGVYMRFTDDTINSNSVYTDVNWSTDEPVYYDDSLKSDEDSGYYYYNGVYSTEMTVYILNEETVASYTDVVDNGDGTYTQTYTLKDSAAYLYGYKMLTNGGLASLPEFESISMTVTFDDNYRVLEIVTEESVHVAKSAFNMSTDASTTTTFTYGEEAVNEDHFGYYDSYYVQYVGELTQSGGTETSVDYMNVLLSVFGSALTSEGQQFEVTLNVGEDTILYGRLYVSVDISNLSLENVDVRLALSADGNIDSQDLYIELSGGEVNCYYSTNFALTVNISDISDIIDSFTEFVNDFEIGAAEGEEGSAEEVLAALLSETTDEPLDGDYEDGELTVTIDYSGISLNLVAQVSEDDGVYTLVDGTLGVSYGGADLGISLGIEPSSAATISHDSAESPFNLKDGADSLLALLNSESIDVNITVQGAGLSQLLAAFGADVDVSDLVLEIKGSVDIDGLTVAAGIKLTSAGDAAYTYLDADVYYLYNGSSPKYGTAYVNILTLLGEEVNLKVSCEIDDLVSAISAILSAVQGSEAAAQSDISSIISAVFSLDFGNVISDLTANGSTVGATINLDGLFAQLGVDLELGDITLAYTIGEDGVGSLEASAGDLLSVSVSGSDEEVVVADTEGYVDIGFIADFVTEIFTKDESSTTTSLLYTFHQDELSLDLNASFGSDLTLETSIVIKDVYITVGVDEDGEFLLSFTGELQNSWMNGYIESQTTYYTSTASTIGFTYYNGYITLVRGDEYRVMTADYLLDNLLTYDSSTYSFENVLSWYLGMGSDLKVLLSYFGYFLPTVSSGALEAEDVYLYDTSDSDTSGSSILDYLLGYILTDGENTISSSDMSSVLANLGLTSSSDSYLAISINAGAITSVLDTLDVAIVGDSETGEGSIKAYVSVYGVISTLLDLSSANEYTVPNFYKVAVENYGIDFNYDFSDEGLETGHTAIFGEFNSADYDAEAAGSGYSYSETLVEYTLSIYSGEELIGTQTVQYGATVYLYDTSSLVTIDGVEYIYVCYGEDGNVVTDGSCVPVTSVTVSGDISVYLVPAADYFAEE